MEHTPCGDEEGVIHEIDQGEGGERETHSSSNLRRSWMTFTSSQHEGANCCARRQDTSVEQVWSASPIVTRLTERREPPILNTTVCRGSGLLSTECQDGDFVHTHVKNTKRCSSGSSASRGVGFVLALQCLGDLFFAIGQARVGDPICSSPS